MKKFLLFSLMTLLVGCVDYTDDFNAINDRLDALEEAVPTIEEQIESINSQLTSLKATDEAIKAQIAELEKSDKATATEIADLKAKDTALEKAISDLQNYVDTQIANAKSEAAAAYATIEQYNDIVAKLNALQSSTSKLGEELTAKINAEVKSLTDKITDLENRLKAVEDKVENLLARIQSVSYIPEYSDGKATVKYVGTKESSEVTLDFEVSPKDAVAELAKVWQDAVSVKAVYTETRAVSFIEMPIVKFEADTENGIISVTASGENLSEEFFAGTQETSAALVIGDGNNSITSDYIQIIPSQMDVSPKSLYFSYEGGSQTIYVTTNIEYEISENSDWISIEKDSFGINIIATTNSSIYERSVDIIISNAEYDLKHIVHIVQEAMSFKLNISLGGSRIALGEEVGGIYSLFWLPEDKVWCNGIISNQTIVDKYSAQVATFKFNQISTPPYNIVHPAPEDGVIAIKEGCCPILFPTTQNYIKNSYDVGGFLMYNYTSESYTSLKPISGLFVMAIKGNGETLSHIILSADTGYISGIFDLNCQSGEITPQDGKVSNQIRYDFGDGLRLNAEEAKMYIAVPPGNYGIITFSIYTIDNKCMTVSLDTTPIASGIVREFVALEFSENNIE